MLTILKRLLAMQIKIEYKQRFYMGIYILICWYHFLHLTIPRCTWYLLITLENWMQYFLEFCVDYNGFHQQTHQTFDALTLKIV